MEQTGFIAKNRIWRLATLIFIGLSFSPIHAHEGHHESISVDEKVSEMQNRNHKSSSTRPLGPSDCSDMQVWDYPMAMCMPLAMKDMPMRMLMVQGNSFFTQSFAEGPRGRNEFAVPNMFMVDIGSTLGNRHYLNLDFMGTVEKWTFPEQGYPELLQIGEENQDHVPYIDAQHPHSSPVMGITLSDTISLGREKDHVKFWFSPRGQSTDGPIAFMHRPTGMANPDAPLGHHIGQDIGHISSTVFGTSLRLGKTNFETSIFNGTEPQPTEVDLPLGKLNSYAGRIIHQFTPHTYAMASAAYVKNPEPHDPELNHIWRYSASVYNDHSFSNGWMIHNAFIWGLVNFYDDVSALNSFAEEFWLRKNQMNFWGRLEYLERTANELQINSVNLNDPKWVTALTLGYTHRFANWDGFFVGLGGSVTKDFLPRDFRADYGGEPLTAKLFLQVGGMKMWHF